MNKIRVLITKEYIAVILYFLLIIVNSWGYLSGGVVLFSTIAFNLYYLYKFRNTQPLVICLSFTMSYWLYMIFYYFYNIPYCTYLQYQDLSFTNGTLRVVGVFFVLLFHKTRIINDKISQYLPTRNNKFIFLVCMIVMLMIVLYTISIGKSFSYKTAGVNTSLYEYYIIFALLAFCYGNKNEKIILLIINALYIVSLLKLGLRLVVLQVLLMLFIQYFDKKVKTKYLSIVIVLGFVFMSFWSMYRSGINAGNSLSILFGIDKDVLITNQGDVFYTSSAQYAQIDLDIWNLKFRLMSALSFICNIFLLPGQQLVYGKLNEVLARQFAFVPGGGFGAMYFYVWFGWAGVYIFASYIAKMINKIDKNKNFNSLYGIFLVLTFFRWYSYNVAVIFKMGFWFMLIYLITKIYYNSTIISKGKSCEKI